MAVLRLHVEARTDVSPGAPLVASVLTEDLRKVAETTVPLGGVGEVEVGAGSYLVRAVAPAGSTLAQRATVGPEDRVEVDLGLVPSPQERLEWHALLGDVTAPPSAEPSHALAEGVWMRVWRRGADGTWTIEPVSWTTTWDGTYATARASGLEPAPRVLQLGGESLPWRLIALPDGERIDVLLQSSPSTPQLDAAVEASVVTDETRGEVLLRYLDRGQIEAAGVVAEGMLADPDAAESPTAALALGYYLLRVGRLDRVASVRPSVRAPWLPDGWIVEGLAALRRSDAAAGRASLVRAASLGVPLYAEGMRLLSTGLRLLEGTGGADPDVEGALERVSRLAAATNWSEAITTYYGPDPATPTLEPPTGIPDGPLTWMGPEAGAPPPPPPRPRPRWLRWLAAGAVVVAAIAGLIWWATRGGGDVAADPSTISFGEQAVEASGAPQTITVSNDTGSSVAFRGAAIRGPAADDFEITTDTCSDARLPDGGSCSLLVVFTPTAEGTREARLAIRHDGEGGPLRVPLEGVGVIGEPEEPGVPMITVDPTSLTFPADVPEGGLTQELTISNDGEAVLEVATSLDPEGEGFTLTGADQCAEVQAGGTCTLSVTFTPFRGTRGEATVVIANNATDEAVLVPVAGTPRAEAAPTEIGTTDWEDSAATITVTNTGTRAFSAALMSQPAPFVISEEDCSEVVIGGACSVTVIYDSSLATSSDDLAGSLTIDDGSGGEPVVVPMRYPTPVD